MKGDTREELIYLLEWVWRVGIKQGQLYGMRRDEPLPEKATKGFEDQILSLVEKEIRTHL